MEVCAFQQWFWGLNRSLNLSHGSPQIEALGNVTHRTSLERTGAEDKKTGSLANPISGPSPAPGD